MNRLIASLLDAIYTEPREGRKLPARIELQPDAFRHFQAEHREALAALLPEVENVYPGSLAGVPVVEVSSPRSTMVRADGTRVVLALPER